MLKNCAANRKRQISALPNVGPYIYTTLIFLALQEAPYICIYIHYYSRISVNSLIRNMYQEYFLWVKDAGA
jgi:hypothetical protein